MLNRVVVIMSLSIMWQLAFQVQCYNFESKGLHLGKFISPGPTDHFPNSGIFSCSLERYGIAQLGYCMGRTHANSEWPLLISRAQAAKTFAHNGSMDASNSNQKICSAQESRNSQVWDYNWCPKQGKLRFLFPLMPLNLSTIKELWNIVEWGI